MFGGELGGPLARVSLIDVSDLDVLLGRLLYLLGEFLHLLAVVFVGRTHAQGEQVSQSVHRRMHLGALLALVSESLGVVVMGNTTSYDHETVCDAIVSVPWE